MDNWVKNSVIHPVQTTVKDTRLHNYFYTVLCVCDLEKCLCMCITRKQFHLLLVGKKEVGQPYVNTFSSLEPSGSHSLCSFEACTEVNGGLGQSDIASGGCLEQFCSRACISFQDVDHKREKKNLGSYFTPPRGLFIIKRILITAHGG